MMKTILGKWLKRNFTDPEAISLLVWLVGFFIVLMTMGKALFPIIASIVIAYLLNNFVMLLEKWKFPRLVSFYLVFSIFISCLVVILLWLLPFLSQQLSNLFTEAPRMLMRGQHFLHNLPIRNPEIFSSQQINYIINEFSKYISMFGQFLLSFSLESIGNILKVQKSYRRIFWNLPHQAPHRSHQGL